MGHPVIRTGIVITDGATRWPVHASLAHVLVLTGLSASLSLSGLPGVACGSFAIIGGLVADVAVTQAGALSTRPAPTPAPLVPGAEPVDQH